MKNTHEHLQEHKNSPVSNFMAISKPTKFGVSTAFQPKRLQTSQQPPPIDSVGDESPGAATTDDESPVSAANAWTRRFVFLTGRVVFLKERGCIFGTRFL